MTIPLDIGEKIAKIFYIHRRLLNRFLKADEQVRFSAEQRKILASLAQKEPQTLTDLSIVLGLAKNTLTQMLLRLEQEQLIVSAPHPEDKRKKWFYLSSCGKDQTCLDRRANDRLDKVLYQGFSDEEQRQFEAFLLRIEENLVRENDKF